jgi:hypothetical protein
MIALQEPELGPVMARDWSHDGELRYAGANVGDA